MAAGAGGRPYLLLTQDDDSRRVVGALLVPRETSWTHLQVVRQTVQAYGRPLAYDVDHHRIFRWVTHQSDRDTVTTAEAHARVQCRRVLRSLDIGIIQSTKGEPEAQGQMETRFDDFQRRLFLALLGSDHVTRKIRRMSKPPHLVRQAAHKGDDEWCRDSEEHPLRWPSMRAKESHRGDHTGADKPKENQD